MAKQIRIDIQESEYDLKSLLSKQSKLLQYQRVKALLLIKQGRVSYTYELAKKLIISKPRYCLISTYKESWFS